jgi:hypothetical protein
MDASDYIAIVAVALSGSSLLLAIRADRRAERADQRTERANQRAKRAEERALEAESRTHLAQLAVIPEGHEERGDLVGYDFSVRNLGPAVVRGVVLWLRDEEGNDVSAPVGDPDLVLTADDPPVQLARTWLTERRMTEELWVWLSYADDLAKYMLRSTTRPT